MFHRIRVAAGMPFVAIRLGVVLLAALVVGVVVNPLAGAVVAAIGLLIAVTLEAIRSNGELREAQQAPHLHGGAHHVLVVADAPLAGEEPASEIVRLAGPDARLDVLAPTLVSRLHYLTTEEEAEIRDARLRLEESLVWARRHGFKAGGRVGTDEPITALADELRDFGAVALVIVTDESRAGRRAAQLELERACAELDIPVALLMAPPAQLA